MTTLIDDLQSYQSRRRFPGWQPKAPNSRFVGDKESPQFAVLLRCLDFLPLELQVQIWDYEAANVPELELAEIEAILERNSKDELKHDQALTHLSQYLGKPEEVGAEAQELIDRWIALNCHPVISMYALEIGVFFSILPTLIQFGDVYAATVAQWISDDERCHVETGLRLMKGLSLKLTEACVKLIIDTNRYIFAPLGEDKATQQAKRAVNRTLSTKDPQMVNESIPSTIAFFEQHSRQSIVY
jgi:hypothetical protein